MPLSQYLHNPACPCNHNTPIVSHSSIRSATIDLLHPHHTPTPSLYQINLHIAFSLPRSACIWRRLQASTSPCLYGKATMLCWDRPRCSRWVSGLRTLRSACDNAMSSDITIILISQLDSFINTSRLQSLSRNLSKFQKSLFIESSRQVFPQK